MKRKNSFSLTFDRHVPGRVVNFTGAFLVSALLFSCSHRHGPLSEKDNAVIRDSVLQLMTGIAQDLSANGPAVWLNYFDDAPGFFMVSDGDLDFPDYNTAKRFVLDTLVKNIPKITLSWSMARVDPLSRHVAAIVAGFHEVLTTATGENLPVDGYFSGTAVHTAHGWKLLNLHWSTRKLK
jgi:hypothetical protein